MIDSIIEGISTALNAEFGDRYKIYVNELKQGLKEPCFFISCIRPTSRRFFNRRYFREHSFCIQYFPESRNRETEECNDVTDRLFLCLEYITVTGDLMMGTKMRSELVDGVLNFFVNFDLFVKINPDEIPVMEELSQTVSAKG